MAFLLAGAAALIAGVAEVFVDAVVGVGAVAVAGGEAIAGAAEVAADSVAVVDGVVVGSAGAAEGVADGVAVVDGAVVGTAGEAAGEAAGTTYAVVTTTTTEDVAAVDGAAEGAVEGAQVDGNVDVIDWMRNIPTDDGIYRPVSQGIRDIYGKLMPDGVPVQEWAKYLPDIEPGELHPGSELGDLAEEGTARELKEAELAAQAAEEAEDADSVIHDPWNAPWPLDETAPNANEGPTIFDNPTTGPDLEEPSVDAPTDEGLPTEEDDYSWSDGSAWGAAPPAAAWAKAHHEAQEDAEESFSIDQSGQDETSDTQPSQDGSADGQPYQLGYDYRRRDLPSEESYGVAPGGSWKTVGDVADKLSPFQQGILGYNGASTTGLVAVLAQIVPGMAHSKNLRRRKRNLCTRDPVRDCGEAAFHPAIVVLNATTFDAAQIARPHNLTITHPIHKAVTADMPANIAKYLGESVNRHGFSRGCLAFAVPGLETPAEACYITLDESKASQESREAFATARAEFKRMRAEQDV